MEIRRGGGSLRTGVTGSCELPYGYWELNPGSLIELQVLLTVEPSLKPLILPFLTLKA